MRSFGGLATEEKSDSPKERSKKAKLKYPLHLREVREETGFEAKIKKYAGSTHYLVGDVPKMVSYFIMRAKDEEAVGSRRRRRGRGTRVDDAGSGCRDADPRRRSALTRAIVGLPG